MLLLPNSLSLSQAKTAAAKYLLRLGVCDANLSAEILLAHVLNKKTTFVFAHPFAALGNHEREIFLHLVERRAQGEPIAYLVGRKEFYSREFEVNMHTLIPRSETELLVDVVNHILSQDAELHVVADVGTGCGAIAVTLQAQWPKHSVWGLDISQAALAVAERNAFQYCPQLNLLQSDLLSGLTKEMHVDVVCANLPYIAREDLSGLARDVKEYEPSLALDGGRDGLELIERLIKECCQRSAPPTWLVLELGDGQAKLVKEMFASYAYTEFEVFPDISGILRVVQGKSSNGVTKV